MDRRFDAELEYVLNLVRDTVAPDAIPMANAIQDLRRVTKMMQKAKDKDYAEWLHEEKTHLDQKLTQLDNVGSHAEHIHEGIEALRKGLETVIANTRHDNIPKDHEGHAPLLAAIAGLQTNFGDFAKSRQLDEMSQTLNDNTNRMKTLLARFEDSQNSDERTQRLENLVTQLQQEVSDLRRQPHDLELAHLRDNLRTMEQRLCEKDQALSDSRKRFDELNASLKLHECRLDILARTPRERPWGRGKKTSLPRSKILEAENKSLRPKRKIYKRERRHSMSVGKNLVLRATINVSTVLKFASHIYYTEGYSQFCDFLEKGSKDKWFCCRKVQEEGSCSEKEVTLDNGGCKEHGQECTLAMVTMNRSARRFRLTSDEDLPSKG